MSTQRPAPMRRQGSQSSGTSKHPTLSPASVGEPHPLRQHIKPGRKKATVLPRNHSSGRNLVKLAQQAQNQLAAEEARKGSRHKSRDSDTEIRLPRSLEEHRTPPLRRNFTATQLPRNTSHTKLKKNLSHGQLTKLALNATALKGPPSPGLKGRNKRPKSADMANIEKDLYNQEVERAQERQQKNDAPKKVGFAVGSSDEPSDADDAPHMDGPGLQEDEWTDQSASASPYSTRQNSRRASIIIDKPLDRRAIAHSTEVKDTALRPRSPPPPSGSTRADLVAAESVASTDDNDDDDDDSDNANEDAANRHPSHPERTHDPVAPSQAPNEDEEAVATPRWTSQRQAKPSAARIPSNPATRHLMTRNNQSPAPALVSNVSALDASRSGRSSPAHSVSSLRYNPAAEGSADAEQEELVSRFVPSASHPTTSSGGDASSSVPQHGDTPYTPESEGMLAMRQRAGASNLGLSATPVSPESARSFSSGAQTPALSRWRNEEKMMNEKAMAEMEDSAVPFPMVPPHVFDRRNESLKSYLNLASIGTDGRAGLAATAGLTIGAEIFEGRFKAVNAELRVIQRFRDPTAESISRLRVCKERDLAKVRAVKASGGRQQQQSSGQMHISKSTTSLLQQPSNLSTSTSPPASGSPVKPAMTSARSSINIKRGGGSSGGDGRRNKVTFTSPRDGDSASLNSENKGADAIARRMWDEVGA